MKKFRFRLENVRKDRKVKEEIKNLDWTRARILLSEKKDELAGLQSDLIRARAENDDRSIGGGGMIDSGMLFAFAQFEKGQRVRMEQKQNEIARAERLTQKTKELYLEAHQKRQSLEKLKEKQREKYLDQHRKFENKILDDLYIMRSLLLKEEDF
jgi:flagellar export protein FliJ